MATTSSYTARGRLNAWDSIAASTTDSALVAAQSGKRIRVHGFIINQGDTTPSTVTFNSKPGGAGSAIFPPLKTSANGGFVVPDSDSGWFQTNVGEGLSVTTGAGSTSTVMVSYSVVS